MESFQLWLRSLVSCSSLPAEEPSDKYSQLFEELDTTQVALALRRTRKIHHLTAIQWMVSSIVSKFINILYLIPVQQDTSAGSGARAESTGRRGGFRSEWVDSEEQRPQAGLRRRQRT